MSDLVRWSVVICTVTEKFGPKDRQWDWNDSAKTIGANFVWLNHRMHTLRFCKNRAIGCRLYASLWNQWKPLPLGENMLSLFSIGWLISALNRDVIDNELTTRSGLKWRQISNEPFTVISLIMYAPPPPPPPDSLMYQKQLLLDQ